MGFTSIVHQSVVKPQCVVCCKVLTQESMKPSKLRQHFESCHGDLVGKDVEYFKRKEASLKSSRMDSTGHFAHQNRAALEVSYRIAFRIAQSKKPHTIGEELIKPCLLETAKLMLGDEQADKLKVISLSNDTVRSRISEMSVDILDQVVTGVRKSPMYSFQLDESTDVSFCSQLLVWVRYLENDIMKEEYLFSEPLSTTTRGEDIFQLVEGFLIKHELGWDRLVGMCTDGAPAMTGHHSGFKALVKNVAQHLIHPLPHPSQCFGNEDSSTWSQGSSFGYCKNCELHSRRGDKLPNIQVLCEEMGANFTGLLYHTEVRWLSRGEILQRVVELREEITEFLGRGRSTKEVTLRDKMQDEEFIMKVSYLCDFFSEVNCLNLSLQGPLQILPITRDKVSVFKRKIQLYQRRVQEGDTSVFTELTTLMEGSESADCSFKDEILLHLVAVVDSIDKYFAELDERARDTWIMRPFSVGERIIPGSDVTAKLEFVSLREDLQLKAEFAKQEVQNFWVKIQKEYPVLSKKALAFLIQAPTTYRCEAGFSAMVALKVKSRNRMVIDSHMRCCLSTTSLRFDLLVAAKQYQPPH